MTYQRSRLLRPLKEISSCGWFRTYMLSVLIRSRYSYSAMLLAEQQMHQRSVQLGPLVACHFNGRTAQPLEPSPAPGCDEPTSRCQTPPSMWALGGDQPVIPGVPFILWAMALPCGTTGSLCSTFVPDRLVGLSVKHPYAIALYARLPSVLRVPLEASVTLLEATTPVKLPTTHCLWNQIRL